MKPERDLASRFRRNLDRILGESGTGGAPHLLLALSGGLDSTVLLHLLRFRVNRPLRLTAAHFDHRMRPESPGDTLWARGVCTAWAVPFISGIADSIARSEEEARTKRYAFLHAAASEAAADWIVTAHHADDQAETVLFRILRGTGPSGLRGIPERTEEGLLRPLLPFWREEIAGYAEDTGLRWREDSTNRELGAARNRLRNSIIPQLEREIAPGARRSLVRLAELAQQSEEGWAVQVARLRERLVREESGAFLVARGEIAGYDPELGARLIRDVLRQLRSVPDWIGTRKILQFITDAASGRRITLPGGVEILVAHDVARISTAHGSVRDDEHWVLSEPPDDRVKGAVRLGDRKYQVEAYLEEAGSEAEPGEDLRFVAPLATVVFPIRLRARDPGDRIRLPGGSKSVKKLLIERRVASFERDAIPILVDSTDRVLWIAGVASAVSRPSLPGEPILNIVLK